MVNEEKIKKALLAQDPKKTDLKSLLYLDDEGSAKRRAAYDCATTLCYETVMALDAVYSDLSRVEKTKNENLKPKSEISLAMEANITTVLQGHHNKLEAANTIVMEAIEKSKGAPIPYILVEKPFEFLKKDEQITHFKAVTEKAIICETDPKFFAAFAYFAEKNQLFVNMDILIIQARIKRGIRRQIVSGDIRLDQEFIVDLPICQHSNAQNSQFSDDTKALLKLLSDSKDVFTNDELKDSQKVGQEWQLLRGIVTHGQLNLLKVFLQAYPQAIQQSDAHKEFNLVETAAKFGHTDIALFLIDKYPVPEQEPKTDDKRVMAIRTALKNAAFAGKSDTVASIVGQNSNCTTQALYEFKSSYKTHGVLVAAIEERVKKGNSTPEQIIRDAYASAKIEIPPRDLHQEEATWLKYRPIHKTPIAAAILTLLVGAAVGLGLGYGEADVLGPFDSMDDTEKNEKLVMVGLAFFAAAITALLGTYYVSHETKKVLTFRDTTKGSDTNDKPVPSVNNNK